MKWIGWVVVLLGCAAPAAAPGDAAPPARPLPFAGAGPCPPPAVFQGELRPAWGMAIACSISGTPNELVVSNRGTTLLRGDCHGDLHLGTWTLPEPLGNHTHRYLAAIDPDGVPLWAHWYTEDWIPVAAGFDAQDSLHVLGVGGGLVDLGDGPVAQRMRVAELDANGERVRIEDVPVGWGTVAVGPTGQIAVADDTALYGWNHGATFKLSLQTATAKVGALSFDDAGNLTVSASFRNLIDWVDPPIAPPLDGGSFLASLDPTGAVRWVVTPLDFAPYALSTRGTRTFLAGFPSTGAKASDAQVVQALDGGARMPAATWTASVHGGGEAQPPHLAALPDGGAVVAGTLRGSGADLGLGWLEPTGNFVARLDSAGRVVGAAAFRNAGTTAVPQVAADARGGVLVISNFVNAIDVGTGPLLASNDYLLGTFLTKLVSEPAGEAAVPTCPGPPAGLLEAPVPTRPSFLAIAGDNVAVGGGYQVATLPLTGGAPRPIARASSPVAALRIDARSIYWATAGTTQLDGTKLEDAGIFSAPIAGGATTVLADRQGTIAHLALAADRLYWATKPTPRGTSVELGKLMSVSLSEGRVEELASGLLNVSGLAAGDGFAVVAASPSNPGSTELLRISLSPKGESALLRITEAAVEELLLADDQLFWFESPEAVSAAERRGSLLALPVTGGRPTVLADRLTGPSNLVATADSLYYVAADNPSSSRSLYRLPQSGGTASPVKLGFSQIDPVAADARHVVWLEITDNLSWALRSGP